MQCVPAGGHEVDTLRWASPPPKGWCLPEWACPSPGRQLPQAGSALSWSMGCEDEDARLLPQKLMRWRQLRRRT